jgi:CRP/FNR family cyclic AMP-dependent transcriptional regulator
MEPVIDLNAWRHTPKSLQDAGEPIRFKKGRLFWRHGEACDGLIVVRTGAVKVFRQSNEGRPLSLELVLRGGVVGEEAALPGARRMASVQAVTPGRALYLSHARLRGLLADDPDVLATLFEVHSARADRTFTRLEELAEVPVEGRVARLISRLANEVGLPDARGTFVPLKLSRVEIAQLASCRSETVIRLMTRWKEAGLVITQREGLVITEPEQLAALC